MWSEISKEFTKNGTYAQTDLHTQLFLNLKLQRGIKVHHFLDRLWTKHKELVSVRVIIDDKDYWLTIIKSLPDSLTNFAFSQFATMHLYSFELDDKGVFDVSNTLSDDEDLLNLLLVESSDDQRGCRPIG